MEGKPWVKASEIEEYVYCPRAWWLRFAGLLPAKTAAMSAGTAKHEQLATRLEANHRQKARASPDCSGRCPAYWTAPYIPGLAFPIIC